MLLCAYCISRRDYRQALERWRTALASELSSYRLSYLHDYSSAGLESALEALGCAARAARAEIVRGSDSRAGGQAGPDGASVHQEDAAERKVRETGAAVKTFTSAGKLVFRNYL